MTNTETNKETTKPTNTQAKIQTAKRDYATSKYLYA